MHYFSIFSKNVTNRVLFFVRLDENHLQFGDFLKILKIYDENSIEKLNFYFNFILRKFVCKNRAFGNYFFSTTIFFGFAGGAIFPSLRLPSEEHANGTGNGGNTLMRKEHL